MLPGPRARAAAALHDGDLADGGAHRGDASGRCADTADLRGRIAEARGDRAAAVAAYVRAGDVVRAQALIDATAATDPARALTDQERLVAALRDDRDASEVTGQAWWRLGQLRAAAGYRDPAHRAQLWRSAEAAYEQALRLAPNEETYLLAAAYQSLANGDARAAQRWYARAAEVVPDSAGRVRRPRVDRGGTRRLRGGARRARSRARAVRARVARGARSRRRSAGRSRRCAAAARDRRPRHAARRRHGDRRGRVPARPRARAARRRGRRARAARARTRSVALRPPRALGRSVAPAAGRAQRRDACCTRRRGRCRSCARCRRSSRCTTWRGIACKAHTRPYARAYFGGLQSRAYRGAAAIVADSRFTADEYRALIDPGAQVDVVYPGVDERFARIERRPGEAPFALVTGTVEVRKNLLVLVEALPSLPSLRVVSVGPHTRYARRRPRAGEGARRRRSRRAARIRRASGSRRPLRARRVRADPLALRRLRLRARGGAVRRRSGDRRAVVLPHRGRERVDRRSSTPTPCTIGSMRSARCSPRAAAPSRTPRRCARARTRALRGASRPPG